MNKIYRYRLFFSLVLSVFLSCEKENLNEQDAINEEITEETIKDEGIDVSESFQKVLIHNGKPVYAGNGYSPVTGREYRPAVNQLFVKQDHGNLPLAERTVEVVETNDELERFLRKSTSTNVNFLFKIFGFGRSSKKTIEERIKMDENHITVIARIYKPMYRYGVPEGFAPMEPRAAQLLDQKDFDRFFKKFGTAYVSDHILGGEVYYIYNYDISSLDVQTRTNFKNNASIYVKNIFGINTGQTVSQEYQQLIQNSVETYDVVSNINGFAPQLVTSEDDTYQEDLRITSYLTENPTKAATLSMTLFPWSKTFQVDVLMQEKFKEEFNKEAKRYQDFEKWEELRVAAKFVFYNSRQPNIKNRAREELEYAEDFIATRYQNPNGHLYYSIPPGTDRMNSFMNPYNTELFRREVARELVTVLRYDPTNHVGIRGNSYYRAGRDPILESRGKGYTEESMRWFAKPFPGTVPIWEFIEREGDRRKERVTITTDYNANFGHRWKRNDTPIGYTFPENNPHFYTSLTGAGCNVNEIMFPIARYKGDGMIKNDGFEHVFVCHYNTWVTNDPEGLQRDEELTGVYALGQGFVWDYGF